MSSLSENLKNIKEAVHQHSQNPEKVRILGVTKFQPLERVMEAVEQGVYLLGVNYVQEGEKLRDELKDRGIEWHFIGHIQSRKAKQLLDFSCVQSLDRVEVAEEMNRRLGLLKKQLNVLVEVNIGLEPQKSGVMPEEVDMFLSQLQTFTHLTVTGLMAMPPLLPGEERRQYFRKMKALYDRLSTQYPFTTLSMGTSEDYSIALEEGSNLIRLGTCLFGNRW